MENILISVILPCHNIEKHLPQCMTDIISQNLNQIKTVSKQDIEKCPNPKRIYRVQMEDLALGLMSNGAKKKVINISSGFSNMVGRP